MLSAMRTFGRLLILSAIVATAANALECFKPFPFDEEQEAGTVVGKIPLDGKEFRSQCKENAFFKLDNKTGKVTTKVKLDRESMTSCTAVCDEDTTCNNIYELSFTAFVQTVDNNENCEVIVRVEDINDNSPEFPSRIFNGSFSEDQKVNASFKIDQAHDKDKGAGNGIERYEIRPPSDVFRLSVEEVTPGEFTVNVVMKQSLDREKQDLYQITVVAIDGGNRSGEVTVNIHVIDVNDIKPKFTQNIYNVTVDEGVAQGSVILTVTAKDEDLGKYGQITYKLNKNANDDIKDHFRVDETTGDISLKRGLVYSADNFLKKFFVQAFDGGDVEQLMGSCEVYVYVNDSKNSPPVIAVTVYSFIVNENHIGRKVAFIQVTDADSGANGKVSCKTLHPSFSLTEGPERFDLVVDATLDREFAAQYNVTVVCSDGGNPSLSSSASAIINISDVNDNAPEFTNKSYEKQIYENSNTEEIIVQVFATDKDIGKNKEIHYSINQEQATGQKREQLSKISVNPNNGVVTVRPSFDREVEPLIIFEVLATDSGAPPLTGTATVTLIIKDRNDNAPTFTLTAYQFNVEENSISGESLGKFTAVDKDIGDNGKFTFALSSEYVNKKLPFTVFANGEIKTNRALNREEKSRYDFRVTVTDQGPKSLSNSVQVVVLVQDVNDNPPNITFPRKGNNSVHVLYPDVPRDFSIQIEAYDIDEGENKTLTYDIKSGNELGLFKIDSENGNIVVIDRSVMIDHDLTIPLLIKVSDNGAESLSSSYELIVTVIYSNGTYGAAKDVADNKYVIISVVVVVITILISAVIIGVIILLRNLDKKKNMLKSDKLSDSSGFETKPNLFIINNAGESHTDGASSPADFVPKKKEVSFSLDDQDSIVNYHQQTWKSTSIPEPVRYAPEKPPRRTNSQTKDEDSADQLMYDRVTTRLENFKLQQLLMETRAKQNLHVVHANPEDSRSETSGETIASDSGRGASEEEMPSTSSPTSHDGQRIFTFPSSVKKPSTSSSRSSFPSSSLSSKNNQRLSPPPIPSRTYKPYSSFNNSHNQPSCSTNYVSNPSYVGRDVGYHGGIPMETAVVPHQHQQPHSHHPVRLNSTAHSDFSDFSSLPSNFRDSYKSRDDDEYSTTTSGSYTLFTAEDLL